MKNGRNTAGKFTSGNSGRPLLVQIKLHKNSTLCLSEKMNKSIVDPERNPLQR